MIDYAASTVRGTGRSRNEDRILVRDVLLQDGAAEGTASDTLLAVVCDGVGGERCGAEAAQTAAEAFRGLCAASCTPDAVYSRLYTANLKLLCRQRENGSRMATTAAGVVLFGGHYLLFYIGDTRIYRFAEGSLTQLSEDHTAAGSGRNILTRYLGGGGTACLPVVRCRRCSHPPEVLLICTDGISRYVPEKQLTEILASGTSLTEQSEAILRLAAQNGSGDDRSLVLIRCEG